MKLTLILLAALAFALAALADPQIGKPAPHFKARDLNGKIVSLADFRGRIVVLESFDDVCPFSRNHYNTGAMQELQHELATNGVVWLVIDPFASPAEAKRIQADRKMAITHWIVDADAKVARTYAMRTTPQMFVINTNGVIAYQGAIDDRPQPDGDPRKARNYVREAVRALLEGKKVPVPETKPYGCPF